MRRRLGVGRGQAKREGDGTKRLFGTEVCARLMNMTTNEKTMEELNTKSSGLRRTLAGCSVVAMAVGLMAGTSGCVAVVAGAGAGAAVAYVRGDLDGTVNAGFEKAVKAVNGAVADLKFTKVSESKDAMLAIIIARNAADKRIEIRVEQAGEKLSKVKIRVGVFGDEALSLAILDKIKAGL